MGFVEKAYDEVFEEESRVRRNPKFEEHRVHAVLYLLEPTALELKPVDADFMRRLAVRANVIPVIAKADSLTAIERQRFKNQLNADFARLGITAHVFPDSADSDPAPGLDIRRELQPFSVIGSVEPLPSGAKKGRPYPWGYAECDNPSHCDLKPLIAALFTLHREELKELTEDNLYERYRTEKLEQATPKKASSANINEAHGNAHGINA